MRLLVLFLVSLAAWAADYRTGTARIDITPDESIWLAGSPEREHASTGIRRRLYARAVALEDSRGVPVVIVTVDLPGITRQLADEVCARAAKDYGLERAQILLNASHTHNGPVALPSPVLIRELPPEETGKLEAYDRRLADTLVVIIGAALGDLQPARIEYGQGEAGFAVNRHADGLVDHRIPVIRATGEDGETVAVIFGYACDNAALDDDDYEIDSDYAGIAATRLEQDSPGAVALFLALCGADQVPDPRGNGERAALHGEALASEVRGVLDTRMKLIRGKTRTAFQLAALQFQFHTHKQFELELKNGTPAAARRARLMLDAYDARRPIRAVAYPVQAIRLGNGPVLLALGGEVVVDYSLRAAREFPDVPLIVAGFSNDVRDYIPSERSLRESGDEAEGKMMERGRPGLFEEDIEETIFASVRKVLERVGVKAARER